MPLIYITGAAGSGKSTVQQELNKRGFEAYDEDAPDIGAPHNKQTSKAVTMPPAAERMPEWFAQHEWRVLDQALEAMKASAKDRMVFLCGNSFSGDAVWQLFDMVIYLRIDEDTLRYRIAARADNDYGKTEHELLTIIERQLALNRLYDDSPAAIVDSSQPIEQIVNDIISQTSGRQP